MTDVSEDRALPRGGRRMSRRVLIGAIVVGGALLFVSANAHLVYVAVTSQPECVAHPTAEGATHGSFRAAKPAC